MSELTNVARPYAKAAFDYAVEQIPCNQTLLPLLPPFRCYQLCILLIILVCIFSIATLALQRSLILLSQLS